MSVQRADARRNYARLLAVAEAEVAVHGADASLEQIARTAGVGSATLRRHFPNRHALLDAVFRERIAALCAHASAAAAEPDARTALVGWLGAVTTSAATIRGLAVAMTRDCAVETHQHCATAQLTEAATPLVARAAGTLAPGVTVTDLLTLVSGIALATGHHPDAGTEAERLFSLILSGVSPGPR